MKIKPITIDFETEAIEGRPKYPPKPVGVSIKLPGRKSRYFAWGHPVKNNCTKRDAVEAIRFAYKSGEHLLHHNGKFDIDVAQTHMDCADIVLDPLKCHDTQFILFLLDPHSLSLALKPSAEKWLGMPPTEQEAVRQWLVDHWKELQANGLAPASVKKVPAKEWGAYICLAPGDLVGKYADGDVVRTEKLFMLMYPEVVETGQLAAYQREQRLMPILLRNEREGIRCDVSALEKALPTYRAAMEKSEAWLRKTLKRPELNFNAPLQMADALDSAGIVTEWTVTAAGNRSTNKKFLKPEHFKDKRVFKMLGYRNKLDTCLASYMEPWHKIASETGGLVYSGWNQTRNDRDAGTRTGRLSSSPNFMAVAKNFEDKGDGWEHPGFMSSIPHLPLVRQFLIPDKPGHLWGRRDFNQQELRILAHFEDDLLLKAYLDDPHLDVHAFVQKSILELLGIDLPRTPIKTLNFGLIYGQGIGSMAEKLSRAVAEIQMFRNAQFSALPGLKTLDSAIKTLGKAGGYITTWGGRRYYAEEPRFIEGRFRSFEYKLLNYLIQGSAADCAKETLIRYEEVPNKDARFVVTVHDEFNISAPKKAMKKEMLKLRDVMLSVEFDVPLLSDGEVGLSWGALEPLKEPKFDLSRWSAV